MFTLFRAVVDQQKKNYYNHCKKPKNLVRDVRLAVLQNIHHQAHGRHNFLKLVELPELLDFSASFLSSIFLHGLIQGNVNAEAAKGIDTRVRLGLACDSWTQPTVLDIRSDMLSK